MAAPNCFACQGRERAEWCVLTSDEVSLLDRGRVSRDYAAGERIFADGDTCRGVYCIESGLVGLRKGDGEGRGMLLHIVGAGQTLGYRAFLSGENYETDAEALEPSRVCLIDAATVRSLLQRNPELGLRYLARISKTLGEADARLFSNATLPVRARLAHLLSVLIERYGQRQPKGSATLELPLSRKDLAAMIGVTPESLSRGIAALEAGGAAEFTGRRVEVPSLRALLAEFESEPVL